MYILPINFIEYNALAIMYCAIINNMANFVFIVIGTQSIQVLSKSRDPRRLVKNEYISFFLFGSNILCAVRGPPEILLSRRLFTIWKSRSIRAALRPDEQHTEYLPAPIIPIHTYTYMLYFIHLFYCYIIILYSSHITYYYYRSGGSA